VKKSRSKAKASPPKHLSFGPPTNDDYVEPREHPFGAAPDYVEPLRAYRAWQFENGTLLSLNRDVWEPGEAKVASCNRLKADPHYQLSRGEHPEMAYAHHVSPDPDCTCGIYAGKNLEHLVEINYAQMGIHGEVDLWGRVQECELGYRAQYAYPRYFVVPPWLLANFREAEFRLVTLSKFGVDIYVAGEQHVSRDMKKIMLLPKGQSAFTDEGVAQLTSNVQRIYAEMSKRAGRQPEVSERLHINSYGIAVITCVTKDIVVALLHNNTICTVRRDEVRWNLDNYRFECNPSSFVTRAVPRRKFLS
jgi:hypothetical protein